MQLFIDTPLVSFNVLLSCLVLLVAVQLFAAIVAPGCVHKGRVNIVPKKGSANGLDP